jgi:hypothetical protein
MILQRTAELCEDRIRFAGGMIVTSIFGAATFLKLKKRILIAIKR